MLVKTSKKDAHKNNFAKNAKAKYRSLKNESNYGIYQKFNENCWISKTIW